MLCEHRKKAVFRVPGRHGYDYEGAQARRFLRIRPTYLFLGFILWTVLVLMTSYIVHVSYHHQYRPFPMISETGDRQPERFVLTFGFEVGGAWLFLLVWMLADELHCRMRDINACFLSDTHSTIYLNKKAAFSRFYRWLPWITLALGVLLSLGVMFVGLVPDNTVVWLHFASAGVAFSAASLWTFATGWCFRKIDLTLLELWPCDDCEHQKYRCCNVFIRRMIYGLISLSGLLLMAIFRLAVPHDRIANDYFLAVFEFMIVLPLLIFIFTLRNECKLYFCGRARTEDLVYFPMP